MNALRILIILPMHGGSLPVGYYCEEALSGLGHMTEVFDAPVFFDSFIALEEFRIATDRLEQLKSQYMQFLSSAILAKVDSFQPDMVLAMAQAPMSRLALRELRQRSIPTAMWFVEDHTVFTYWRAFAPYYDIFAVIQKEPFLGMLRDSGVTHPLYLPMAAHPPVHRPLELDPVDRRRYGAPVSFMGAGYPNRRVAFKRLLHRDIKIWGSEWDGDPVLEKHVQRGGERIPTHEVVRIFNATDVNLNLHSSVQADQLVSHGDFVNPRTFELAACGAFQLVDERILLPELFETGPDGEIATFSDMEGLERGVDHYLAHPEERRAMARRAHERVLREHTYTHRMERLLEHMEEVLPDWPRKDRGGATAGEAMGHLDPAMVDELLESLRLPGDAAFADVVWALKKRKGELNALETAILFLDEWRRQYESGT